MFANDKAFTLIELIAVVLIVGILAAIGLPQYQRALESSRVSEAITMIGNISTAEKLYYLQTGQFTSDFSNLMLQIPLTPPAKARSASYSYGTGKSFDYDISDCEYGRCSISALRNEKDLSYEIRLSDMDGSGAGAVRSCHADDEAGQRICMLVCGVESMPDGNCQID